MEKAATVEEYLAGIPEDARATLEEVRAAIRSAAPSAVEKMGYGMQGFYLEGHPLTYTPPSRPTAASSRAVPP